MAHRVYLLSHPVGVVIVGPVRADVRIVCGLRLEMLNISQRPAASCTGLAGGQA